MALTSEHVDYAPPTVQPSYMALCNHGVKALAVFLNSVMFDSSLFYLLIYIFSYSNSRQLIAEHQLGS